MRGNGIGGEMTIETDGRNRVTNVSLVGTGRDRYELR